MTIAKCRCGRRGVLRRVGREIPPCRCSEAHTRRGLTDPMCVYHEIFPFPKFRQEIDDVLAVAESEKGQ